jgi:spore coat polysaccharide biosynthesis protein SpsF (cytidylyltransferase family)
MEQLEVRQEVADLPNDYVTKEYRPSKQEALSRYEINIQFMSRGCVIRVGCKTIPFSSTEEAITELQKYFENPYDIQKQWENQLS